MTMHSSSLSLLVTLAVLCLGTLTVCRAATPEVLWDTWGVPHIYAPDDEGLFYGFGWAQAESHADLLLHLYGQARGRGAEYQGEDSDVLAVDRMVRTMGGPRIAEEWYRTQSPDFRTSAAASMPSRPASTPTAPPIRTVSATPRG